MWEWEGEGWKEEGKKKAKHSKMCSVASWKATRTKIVLGRWEKVHVQECSHNASDDGENRKSENSNRAAQSVAH